MRFHSHKTKGLSIGLSKGLSIGKKTVENQCFKVFVTNKRSSHSHTPTVIQEWSKVNNMDHRIPEAQVPQGQTYHKV